MKNKVITVFFIILTFSIGLVSVNLPLSSFAQSNALSQSGNGDDAEQERDQSQSSDQNGQAISGDSSIARVIMF